MTNHIEQLMKAAGVSKYRYFRQYNYAQVPYGKEELQKSVDHGIECVNIHNTNDNHIYWTELHYPAFTPARQLELIKLILKANNVDSFSQYYSEVLKAFVFTCKSLPEMNTYNVWESINTDYALALAELVLRLIEENQLNKSEVKRILEDDTNL